jgi:YopT peptidase
MTEMQSDCRKRGGAYVAYSQCVEPTKTLIEMLPFTGDGICQALAAKWIAEHANDRSIWGWLFAAGSTNVKQGAIANLMVNFTESVVRKRVSNTALGSRRQRGLMAARLSNPTTRSADTGDLYYQDFVTSKYLGLYGLRRRSLPQERIVGSSGARRGVGSGIKAGQNLAAALHPHALCSKGDVYVLISIMGDGGHALAAYVGSQDVAFFDPNFGEYWLPNQQAFRGWFAKFWELSRYGDDFDSFYLLSYGKAM